MRKFMKNHKRSMKTFKFKLPLPYIFKLPENPVDFGNKSKYVAEVFGSIRPIHYRKPPPSSRFFDKQGGGFS